MSEPVQYMFGLGFLMQMVNEPREDSRKVVGYIVLWDGVPVDNADGMGALDRTIGKSYSEAGLFSSYEAAQEAIRVKMDSYRSYAEEYPEQEWPSPSEDDFQIVAVKAGD